MALVSVTQTLTPLSLWHFK